MVTVDIVQSVFKSLLFYHSHLESPLSDLKIIA